MHAACRSAVGQTSSSSAQSGARSDGKQQDEALGCSSATRPRSMCNCQPGRSNPSIHVIPTKQPGTADTAASNVRTHAHCSVFRRRTQHLTTGAPARPASRTAPRCARSRGTEPAPPAAWSAGGRATPPRDAGTSSCPAWHEIESGADMRPQSSGGVANDKVLAVAAQAGLPHRRSPTEEALRGGVNKAGGALSAAAPLHNSTHQAILDQGLHI